MRSRGVQRDCSLRTSNRDASGLAAAAVRAKGWRMIGAYIARLRTSGWKTEQKVAGESNRHVARYFSLPNIFGIGSYTSYVRVSLKVTGRGAGPLDLAGRAQGFRAGFRRANRHGLAEKTCKGVITATS